MTQTRKVDPIDHIMKVYNDMGDNQLAISLLGLVNPGMPMDQRCLLIEAATRIQPSVFNGLFK